MCCTAWALQRENFWVKHYAGKVKYTVEGWVERNMDRIPESFGGTLAASTHTVRKDIQRFRPTLR